MCCVFVVIFKLDDAFDGVLVKRLIRMILKVVEIEDLDLNVEFINNE